MRALTFIGGEAESETRYKWLYVLFNCGVTGQKPDEVARQLAMLDKLDALGVPDETQAWPFVEEARVLRSGQQQLLLTTAEYRVLEEAIPIGMAKFIPTVQKRYCLPVREFVRDAVEVPKEP